MIRWQRQLMQPDGSATKNDAPAEQKEIAGVTVQFFDASGSFLEQRGPQTPIRELPNFRVLGAIIETPTVGNYFIKLYGPKNTIDQNKEAFDKMIDSLKLIKKD